MMLGCAGIGSIREERMKELLAAAKEALDALHQFHPGPSQVGKGICEWGPCARLREAIRRAESETRFD